MKKFFDFVYKLYVKKDPVALSYYKWKKDKSDHLRFDYDLNDYSLIFDVGGYHGDWTAKIFKKYNCNVYVFEPVKSFFEIINNRFKSNEKIKVFNFGLSDSNAQEQIYLKNDASSTNKHLRGLLSEEIKLVDIVLFLKEKNIKKIDLMKINIEGEEYKLLPRLIDSAWIKSCKNLQIQFHNFVENAEELRSSIRKKLSKTHHLTYDYPFLWENWELN